MLARFAIAAILAGVPLAAVTAAAQGDADRLQTQLDVANGMFLRGFFEDAVVEYSGYIEALAGKPVAPEVWYRLGEAAYAAANYDRALEAFEQLQALPGDTPYKQRARLSQGEVYYYMEAYDHAIAVLGPIASSSEDSESRGRALYFLGKAYFDSGKTGEAIARFTTLIEALPSHPMAPYGEFQLAYAYSAQKELENAAIHFSAVAGSRADDALRMESRFRAAQTYDQIGWYSASLGAYEQLQQDFPSSPFREQAGVGHVWALYHEGRCAEAQVAIQAHLKAYPETRQRVELDYVRANCLQQVGENEKALEAFVRIRKTFPDSEFAGRALYKMAWIQYLNNNLPQARDLVTQFLQDAKAPDLTGEGAFLLGTIFVAQGNFVDAVEEFRLVAERYPQSEFGAEALFKAGECLEELAMSDAAAETFEKFVNQYPDHALTPQAILRAGDASFASGAFEAAVERYKKTLEKPLAPEVDEQVLYRLALTYHNMKDYGASVGTLSTLLEEYPNSRHREEALFRVAEHTLKVAGEPVKAVALYQSLIDAAPDGVYAGRALRGLALARYEHKDYDQAAALFLRLMHEHPDVTLNEETYNWTGQWLFDHEQWDDAAASFEALLQAVQAYPYAEQVRLKIAECHEHAGDPDKALAMYQGVADSSTTTAVSTEARWHMARIYEARGELDKAIEWYEAAATSNNGEIAARARFQLGVLHESQSEFDQAARSFMGVDILFVHEELSPEALWRAGQCYEKAARPEQAKKAYEVLKSDYPESAFAQKAGEALQALGTP